MGSLLDLRQPVIMPSLYIPLREGGHGFIFNENVQENRYPSAVFYFFIIFFYFVLLQHVALLHIKS